jgi:PAS domain S-box-containing protein
MDNPFLRILHVDDNVLDRELIQDALEREGNQFTVISAASRSEFETQLAMDSFDLILTDFNILGFEGLQIIEAVRQKNPFLPVIVVTGTGSEEVAVDALKLGAADYVIKSPKHIRRLPIAIRSAIDRKRLLQEQLQSEQALRTSEERLRAFVRALPDLAFIVSSDGYYVQLLSDSEHSLYKEGKHLVGKHITETLPIPIADQLANAIQRTMVTSSTQSVEYKIESTISTRWYEVRISPMITDTREKSLVVYIVRDITQRKMTEAKLKSERNLLRTLIDNVPDYIYVMDQDGRFAASNTAHAAVLHLTPPQIIGKTVADILSPDFARRLHDDDKKIMLTGNPLISEERLIENVDEVSQWVLMTKVPLRDENSEIIGLVGISRDITDRRQAEEALRASEEHLRAVVSGTPVILFELDTKGVLTFLQGRNVNRFSKPSTVDIGGSVLDNFGEFIPEIQEHFRLALVGEETSSILTLGDVILDVHYSPMRNKVGEVSGIVGVATDITERLKAEKLRIELEKEQEMIALKERFIATASHDFRTPLAIIKMNAIMLDTFQDRMTPEQRTSKLRQISIQIDQMAQLLDDVLTMSKANAGKIDFKPKLITLKPFCVQIWENFRNMAEKTHTIDFDFDFDYAEVVLDPNLMQYILVNLLSNAVKYSPQNGHICFRVSNDQDQLIFDVSDNGIGIPESDQAKLFQPFHRAENTRGIDGTGLGLSIVKSYVERHGGSIQLESKEGEGTKFTVSVPLKLPAIT